MTRPRLSRLATGLIVTAVAGATAASATTQTYVDVSAGLGYETNPSLRIGDRTGSGFGRFSLYGYHGWSSERSSTSLSAFVENSAYFRNGNQQVFNLGASTRYAANEKVTLSGSLGFSGDIGGQLSSRFYGVPAGSVTPDPTVPTPIVIVDPNLYGLNRRSYTLSANGGANFVLSPRDNMALSIGAQRLFVSGNKDLAYSSYNSTLGYNRQLNERVTLGGRLLLDYSDYRSGNSVFSVGPQVTISARISEQWDLSAAVGVVRTTQRFDVLGGGMDSSSSLQLALDGSLCRQLEYERICVRAARRTLSSVVGSAPVSTTASFDYYRKLGRTSSVQASASVAHTGSYRLVSQPGGATFYTLSAAYDRAINDRLSGGIQATWRKLAQAGPDPKDDIGGNVYLRYRLGDIR